MGVCEVIAVLADAVAAMHHPLHHRHVLMVHVLRSALVYRQAGRLDAWESAYIDAEGNVEPTPINELLDSIFDLGRNNLYTQFDEAGTQEYYRKLVRQFSEAGILTPEAPDLSDW